MIKNSPSTSKMSTPLIALMLFILLCLGLLCSNQAIAATEYITDEIRVPLRSSPCTTCKIVHRGLKSGLALRILNKEKGWVRVETPDGIQGWVPNHYLSAEPVAKDLMESYRLQAEGLYDQNTKFKEERDALAKENTALKNQLADLGKNSAAVSEELASIRTISADAVNLHDQNRELLKSNKTLQTDIDVLTATKEQLENSQFQKWLLYGGFLVVLGAILSVVLPLIKPKRRGYSEWD